MATALAVSPAEGAALVGCSDDLIRARVKDGTLPRVPHTGRKILIPRAALLEVFGLAEAERVGQVAGQVTSVIDGRSFS